MYYIKKKKSDKPKKRLASKATLIKKLDKVFSQYIRLRDSDTNGYCRCISCCKIHYWKEIQNGHYMSRRYLSTRFDEMNCNAQCVACNIFNQGNIQMYRQNLINKIGEKNVDYLEYKAKGVTVHYSTFELEQLIKYYTVLVKKLSEEKGIKI
ncbi:recombination protein NinG [Hoylesella buccalis]|uniref:Recombinase n=1 Tax=Hoylesella buccalis DNF00853 TaxID=1401074 RepID=A0A095ZEX6_9BACT|nr:recombination protein NinG [Hoylesella buccalis]KGF32921.1 recombinase [Hoylesella buccalis DNF00853]